MCGLSHSYLYGGAQRSAGGNFRSDCWYTPNGVKWIQLKPMGITTYGMGTTQHTDENNT